MSRSECVYRFLLKAYPADFRRAYWEEMVQLFRDRLQEEQSAWRVPRLWWNIAVDLVRTVPARHAERLHPQCGHFGLRLFLQRSPLGQRRLPQDHGIRGWSTSGMKCLFFSRYEAGAFGCRKISVEHLLLGALREDPACTGKTLTRSEIEAIRTAIERNESEPRQIPRNVDLPLSVQAKAAIAEAARGAQLSGDTEVLPRHLVAGILKQESTLAARILRELQHAF